MSDQPKAAKGDTVTLCDSTGKPTGKRVRVVEVRRIGNEWRYRIEKPQPAWLTPVEVQGGAK